MPFSPIDDILNELQAGRMIVLVDDEDRENEGDVICAAQYVTNDTVNFMTREARGMLCTPLDGEICDRLELGPQAGANTAHLSTAYTVTVDAKPRFGITTGISTSDRAVTINRLADPEAVTGDFSRPGHIQPLQARDGGVLVRTGQTEGSVDLCRLAGLRPAAAIIEIMNDDGTMARLPQLERFCQKHDLKMCSVAGVIAYRMTNEKLVERIEEKPFENEFGRFNLIVYRSKVDPLAHVALCVGDVGMSGELDHPVLVRVHTHNLLGDVFGDIENNTGERLAGAMKAIQAAGEGAIVYLRQNYTAGEVDKLQTMHGTSDEVLPDEVITVMGKLDLGIGSQILRDLGVRQLKLLSNHPVRLHALNGFGLKVEGFVPLDE